MIDPIPTAVEPGITADQADRIMTLGDARGLDHDALCSLAQELTGWGDDWIYWDREAAAILIAKMEGLAT